MKGKLSHLAIQVRSKRKKLVFLTLLNQKLLENLFVVLFKTSFCCLFLLRLRMSNRRLLQRNKSPHFVSMSHNHSLSFFVVLNVKSVPIYKTF